MTLYIKLEYSCGLCGHSYIRKWDGVTIPNVIRAETCPQCKCQKGKIVQVRYVDEDGKEQRLHAIIKRTINDAAGYQGMNADPIIEEFQGLGIDNKVIISQYSLWFDYYGKI